MNTDNRLLTNYLILADLLLHREICRLGMRNKQAEKWSASCGLFITGDKLNHLVSGNDMTGQWFHTAYPDESAGNELYPLNNAIDIQKKRIENIKKADKATAENRIELLTGRFELSEDEKLILLVCFIPNIDAKYGQVFSFLSEDANKKHPSPDLILKLLVDTFKEKNSCGRFFTCQAPLFKYHLLEFADQEAGRNHPVNTGQLKVSERIAAYLSGYDYLDPELSGFSEVVYPEDFCVETEMPEVFKERLGDADEKSIIYLYGLKGAGKQETVKALCRQLHKPLLQINTYSMFHQQSPANRLFTLIKREALLIGCVVYFIQADFLFDGIEDTLSEKSFFFNELKTLKNPCFFSTEKQYAFHDELPGNVFFTCGFPVPGFSERKKIWAQCIAEKGIDSKDIDLNILANSFKFTKGRIKNTVAEAYYRAQPSGNENNTITTKEIITACKNQSNQKLQTLSKKVDPVYRWQDIILPPDQLQQLKEMTECVQYRHVVYEEWGFEKKHTACMGVNVLFTGPPGTGKTMAASIIASELQLDLYKIDLSMVMSKYIGETEKNLSKIFKEAEMSNGILFFDEADALFGRRSEIKDAHDRYANIEVGYLLQKMEEYEGIVILATNLRKNMDEAFERRMHFIVEFPFPDEACRKRIWQGVFPDKVPMEKIIDFDFIAKQFAFSGGNIKNIALSASFYAAKDSKPVSMQHLVRAIRRECLKTGKLCQKIDFGKYYEFSIV